jgi:nucleotide-binding universal stress UspA family protein
MSKPVLPVLCGTDFSASGAHAIRAATALAAKLGAPLHLLHSLDVAPDKLAQEPHKAVASWARTQLDAEAERLRRKGLQVATHVEAGAPDAVLLDAANRLQAQLLVVAALGDHQRPKWQLGSHADRVAQRSHTPVLVVRDAQPLEDWALGAAPLRIVLAGDLSSSAAHAAVWVNALSQLGACELVLVHLYWPPEQFQRLGLGGVRSYVDADPEVTRALERDFSERFRDLSGRSKLRFRLEPHLGRVADRLAHIASEEGAALVVVGSHDRGLLARTWEGSVSRGVLRDAAMSVAVVPRPADEQPVAVTPFEQVLVATDFSQVGNAAVGLAYSALSRAGTVHLVHVFKAGASASADALDIFRVDAVAQAEQDAARQQLQALVPETALFAGKQTQLHLLQSHDPATAIAQAAERLGVDLVCLGTHGRAGISKALLGSVAEAVLLHTQRPVLLARAPKS